MDWMNSPFLEGALVIVGLSLAAFCLAILLGFLGTAARLSGYSVLQWGARLYTGLVRGIPHFVWLLFFYCVAAYAGNQFATGIDAHDRFSLHPFSVGVLALGWIYGAWLTDTFRSAIAIIPRGQFEAATAFGMGQRLIFLRITLPQMLRYALPGVIQHWQSMVKATVLVGLIGWYDLHALSLQLLQPTLSTFGHLLWLAAGYWLYVGITVYALQHIHARYSLGSPPYPN
jgi:arginine/ornithine transport system permease protein